MASPASLTLAVDTHALSSTPSHLATLQCNPKHASVKLQPARGALRGGKGVTHVAVFTAAGAETLNSKPQIGLAPLRVQGSLGIRCSQKPQGFGAPTNWKPAKRDGGQPGLANLGYATAATGRQTRSVKEEAQAVVDDLRGTSIFLLGMMGSGKSTIGRVLAEALGYYFFDSDEVVEQAAGGATVAQIFQENGEEAFRDLETKVLSELSSLGRLVVSTGGGAILRPANWSFLQHGITIFIDVPVPVLASRVVAAGTTSRPLLSGAQEEDKAEEDQQAELNQAMKRLQGIFGERSALYRNADTTVSLQRISDSRGVDYEEISPEDIAAEILAEIRRMVAERKQRDKEIQSRAGA